MTDTKPYPFQNGLIIHVNSFTKQIDGGYFVQGGDKYGKTLTAFEVGFSLAANWQMPVSFIKI